jgi:tetratricopeptide (TPR) repeat protein
MPDVVQAESWRIGRRAAVAAVGAALLAVAIWVVVQYANSQLYSTAMSKAGQLDAAGKYDDEIASLSSYIATNPPSGYRYQALLRLGDLQYKQHKYGDAFISYEHAKALASQTNAHIELGIAQSAAALGDRPTAAQAYQELVKLTPVKDIEKKRGYEQSALYYGRPR